MRIIGRDAPAVKLNLNLNKAAFMRKRLRYFLYCKYLLIVLSFDKLIFDLPIKLIPEKSFLNLKPSIFTTSCLLI